MKIILTDIEDAVLQVKAAKYALTLGRPEGTPAFRIITVGDSHFAVRWNKSSVTVYSNKPKS
jgi:hypothetical protein